MAAAEGGDLGNDDDEEVEEEEEEGAGWGQGGRAAGRLRGGGDMRTVDDLVALKRRVQEADRGRSGELGMSEFVGALGGLWPHMSRKGLQRLFMQVEM